MIGLPRSGKSTYVQQWLTERVANESRQLIHADSLRLALGARYNSGTEDLVQSIKHVLISKYSLFDNMWFMIDGTHTSKHSLRRIFELRQDAIPHFIFTSPFKCKERAIASKQPDLCGPINRMTNNLIELWNNHYETQNNEPRWHDDNRLKWFNVVDNIRRNTKTKKVFLTIE